MRLLLFALLLAAPAAASPCPGGNCPVARATVRYIRVAPRVQARPAPLPAASMVPANCQSGQPCGPCAAAKATGAGLTCACQQTALIATMLVPPSPLPAALHLKAEHNCQAGCPGYCGCGCGSHRR